MSTARSVALKAVADGAASASGLVLFPLMATHVGAAGYGAYGQMNSVVAFVIPFASLGVAAAVVRFFAMPTVGPTAHRSLVRILTWATLGGVVAGMAIAAAGATLNDAVLDWPRGDVLFRLGGGLVAVGTLELVLVNYLQARHLFARQALYQLAYTCTSLATVAIALVSGAGVIGVAVALLLLKATSTAVLVLLTFRGKPDATADGDEAVPFGSMVRYGLPLTVAGLGLWLMHLADRFVIGRYMEPAAVGRYGAVYAVVGLVATAATPLYLPAHARIMRASLSGDDTLLHQEIRLFHRYIALTTVCASAGLLLFAQPLVELLGGAEFRVDRNVVALLVAGLALPQWNGLTNYVLLARDRTIYMQNAWLVSGLLNLVLNMAVVPRGGLAGAAAVTAGTFLLFCALTFRAAVAYAPLLRLYAWRSTASAAVAAAVGAVPGSLLLAHDTVSFGSLLLASVVFVAVTGAALIVLRELGSDDLATVRSIARRKPLPPPGPGAAP